MKKILKITLCFFINLRKAFAIKSIPRSVFEIRHIRRTKYVYFLFRLNLDFGFFIKPTVMKQTVYLNNIARKSGFRLHYLRQSAF